MLATLIHKLGLASSDGSRGHPLGGDLRLFPKVFSVEKADRPLNIAVVYTRLPFPMFRGDQLTVAHWLAYLSARGHRVHFVTLDIGGMKTAEVMTWLRSHCASLHLIEHKLLDIVLGLMRAAVARRPIQSGLFDSSRQARQLYNLVAAGQIDVAYTYYVRSARPWLSVRRRLERADLPRPRSVLGMQLSQALNTRRISRTSKNVLERMFYAVESSLMEAYEARIWRNFDLSVLIGPKDLEAVETICRARGQPEIDNYVIIPHGVDIEDYGSKSATKTEDRLVLFSGNLSSHNNISAAIWMIEQVWPIVRRSIPDAKLRIAGRSPAAVLQARDGLDGIEVKGDVPNMAAVVETATICVNPMQSGAGMQNKLIEFLAGRKAVVATSVANEGIMASPGEHLLIADDALQFAEAVVALLNNPTERERLGAAGRRFVEAKWTWEAWFSRLERELYLERELAGAA